VFDDGIGHEETRFVLECSHTSRRFASAEASPTIPERDDTDGTVYVYSGVLRGFSSSEVIRQEDGVVLFRRCQRSTFTSVQFLGSKVGLVALYASVRDLS
jgi:hypothetical protein